MGSRLAKVPLPIAFALVLLAGILAGALIRGILFQPLSGLRFEDLETRLVLGEPLPEVPLVDEHGDTTSTGEILAGRGGVVLFMEVGCPPCQDMVRRWQTAIAHGTVDSASVFGVVASNAEGVPEYRREQGIRFPVLYDHAAEFRNSYGVTAFPLEVIVGRSGRVRSKHRGPFDEVDVLQVQAALAE